MTKQEYIKKARVLLENFDGWREYDEDAHNEFLEALYQLHIEGVREIIGEDENYKPHFEDSVGTDYRNNLRAEQREKLKK